MRCPYCSAPATHVLETRDAVEAIRRRRSCPACARRFTTYERAEALPLSVRKRDGRSEPFEREKLMRGLVRAAAKRPVSAAQLEGVVERIAGEVRAAGGELTTERIGELALRQLRSVDPVAYVRFASVYREFSDVSDFEAELARLEDAPAPEPEPIRPALHG